MGAHPLGFKGFSCDPRIMPRRPPPAPDVPRSRSREWLGAHRGAFLAVTFSAGAGLYGLVAAPMLDRDADRAAGMGLAALGAVVVAVGGAAYAFAWRYLPRSSDEAAFQLGTRRAVEDDARIRAGGEAA